MNTLSFFIELEIINLKCESHPVHLRHLQTHIQFISSDISISLTEVFSLLFERVASNCRLQIQKSLFSLLNAPTPNTSKAKMRTQVQTPPKPRCEHRCLISMELSISNQSKSPFSRKSSNQSPKASKSSLNHFFLPKHQGQSTSINQEIQSWAAAHFDSSHHSFKLLLKIRSPTSLNLLQPVQLS